MAAPIIMQCSSSIGWRQVTLGPLLQQPDATMHGESIGHTSETEMPHARLNYIQSSMPKMAPYTPPIMIRHHSRVHEDIPVMKPGNSRTHQLPLVCSAMGWLCVCSFLSGICVCAGPFRESQQRKVHGACWNFSRTHKEHGPVTFKAVCCLGRILKLCVV